MVHNKSFVDAVKREQESRKESQAAFSRYIGISQGALSKLYKRGVKDGVIVRILAKFPDLAYFFALKDSD